MYRLIATGQWGNLWAIRRMGCQFAEFLAALDVKDKRKVVALCRFLADDGPPRNTNKFKKLTGTDGLWELKPTSTIRILGFFLQAGTTFVITHAFEKKQNRIRKAEITKAENSRRAFLVQYGREGHR